MKMWKKILGAVLAVALMIGAGCCFSQGGKDCCLCGSPRFHAPCLIDLETGETVELALYFPHPTKAAELADPQPETDTFSFVTLGGVKGIKQTGSKTIELELPCSEVTAAPALCRNCRKQLDSGSIGRYALADLYNREEKVIIPMEQELSLELRCYCISVRREGDVLKVTLQGTLRQEDD